MTPLHSVWFQNELLEVTQLIQRKPGLFDELRQVDREESAAVPPLLGAGKRH